MIFDRVVCGIDPGPESLEAARQAARLASPGGRLLLVGVVETEIAVHAGWAAGQLLDELKADVEQAVETARVELAPLRAAETRILEGPVPARLLEVARAERATLLAVGTHGHRRAAGILLGTVATTLLHDAPCGVLIARAPDDPVAFPARIVVGTDGSNEGETALAIASALAGRFGAELRLVVASGGKSVDADAVRAAHPDAVLDHRKPVEALVEWSRLADLIVIGSRGLHGPRALGSVSERVAHEARCSVLVVR